MCTNCNDSQHRATRRSVLGLGIGGVAALASALGPRAAWADCAPFTGEMQAATGPQDALAQLLAGNARFAAGQSLSCDHAVNIAATANSQTPLACVLGCIDSRAAPEILFDQQIGDIFVARVAGNVPTDEVIGSFEYATAVAGTKLIVVLGHSHCGAVKGAVDRAVVGDQLTRLLDLIEPAVVGTELKGERSSNNHHFVESVTETNVRMGMQGMIAGSPVISGFVASGQVIVVGAIYDVETGLVRLLET